MLVLRERVCPNCGASGQREFTRSNSKPLFLWRYRVYTCKECRSTFNGTKVPMFALWMTAAVLALVVIGGIWAFAVAIAAFAFLLSIPVIRIAWKSQTGETTEEQEVTVPQPGAAKGLSVS